MIVSQTVVTRNEMTKEKLIALTEMVGELKAKQIARRFYDMDVKEVVITTSDLIDDVDIDSVRE